VGSKPIVRIERNDSDIRFRDKVNANFEALSIEHRDVGVASDVEDAIDDAVVESSDALVLQITALGEDLVALEGVVDGKASDSDVTALENAFWPQGSYAVDDALSLESNLAAPSTGTAPGRTAYTGPGATGDWSLWLFPNNATRYLQSAVQLPHKYQANTQLMWHVHFIPDTQIEDGETVIFKAEVTYASVHGVFVAEQTYTSTFTSDGVTPVHSHEMTVSVAIPASAPTLGGSGFVLARLYRDTNDTYNGGVWLLGSDYHIRQNRMGSATENPGT
jgi:hypothetical protein